MCPPGDPPIDINLSIVGVAPRMWFATMSNGLGVAHSQLRPGEQGTGNRCRILATWDKGDSLELLTLENLAVKSILGQVCRRVWALGLGRRMVEMLLRRYFRADGDLRVASPSERSHARTIQECGR